MKFVLRSMGLLVLAGLALAIVLVAKTFSYGGGPAIEAVTLPDAPSSLSAERAAQHLSEAIQFRTITYKAGDPEPGDEGPWLALHEWMRTTYPLAHDALQLEKIADYTLLYTWPGQDPELEPLLLMAHQDVVPINLGTIDDWTGDPFAGEIIEGYIYGRGTIDDKGSMVAIMEAVEALVDDGFQPQRTVHLLFGHDEEVSGSGAEAGIAALKARGVSPVMALDEGSMVVDPNPLTGKRLGLIGVSEKGYLTLSLTVSAVGGHSSQPPRDSAAVRLSRAIVALDENQMPADLSKPPIADMFEVAAPDMAFGQRLAFANQWLFAGLIDSQMAAIPAGNAMIRTTTAPTMMTGSAKENVLPQRAMAMVNFRLHPNNTVEDVIAHVRDVTSDIEGLEVTVSGDSIGSEASPVSSTSNRAYAVLNSVARSVGDGAPVAPSIVIGATDARYATAITKSVYRFAPASMSLEDLKGFHGTNERISVENMGRMTAGYAQIILAMDAAE